MISMRHIWVRVGLCALAYLCIHSTAIAQSTPPPAAAVPGSAEQDAQHAFDFEIGSWKVHVYRLQHPLTGSKSWVQYDGTNVVHEVWNGRGNLAELEAYGPAGHVEFMSLRLYDPQGHQWSLNTTSSRQGVLGLPTIGGFKNGRGEFFDTETIDGKSTLVRNAWTDITVNSWTFEQAFSIDGGRTWEVNWVEKATRKRD